MFDRGSRIDETGTFDWNSGNRRVGNYSNIWSTTTRKSNNGERFSSDNGTETRGTKFSGWSFGEKSDGQDSTEVWNEYDRNDQEEGTWEKFSDRSKASPDGFAETQAYTEAGTAAGSNWSFTGNRAHPDGRYETWDNGGKKDNGENENWSNGTNVLPTGESEAWNTRNASSGTGSGENESGGRRADADGNYRSWSNYSIWDETGTIETT